MRCVAIYAFRPRMPGLRPQGIPRLFSVLRLPSHFLRLTSHCPKDTPFITRLESRKLSSRRGMRSGNIHDSQKFKRLGFLEKTGCIPCVKNVMTDLKLFDRSRRRKVNIVELDPENVRGQAVITRLESQKLSSRDGECSGNIHDPHKFKRLSFLEKSGSIPCVKNV